MQELLGSALPSGDELEQIHNMVMQQWGILPSQYWNQPSQIFDPRQQYDYLGAVRGGAAITPDSNGTAEIHWPSTYKGDTHPTRFEYGAGMPGDVGPRQPGTVFDRRGGELMDMTDPKSRQDVLGSLYGSIGLLGRY
jgi:hypothetical protein